jgi:hypothetical protein
MTSEEIRAIQAAWLGEFHQQTSTSTSNSTYRVVFHYFYKFIITDVIAKPVLLTSLMFFHVAFTNEAKLLNTVIHALDKSTKFF